MRYRFVFIVLVLTVAAGVQAQKLSDSDQKEIAAAIAAKIEAVKNKDQLSLYLTMTELIGKNGSIDERSQTGGPTALMLSCVLGDEELVNLLLKKGASVLAEDNEGRTPLLLTVEYPGTLSIVRTLVEKGSKLEAKDKDLNGQTPLMSAAYQRNLPVVQYLLEKGADVNAKKGDGWSVLLIAVEGGDPQVVAALLEKGADHKYSMPSVVGKISALTYANSLYSEKMNANYKEIADILVAHGASVPVATMGMSVIAGGGGSLMIGSDGSPVTLGTAGVSFELFAAQVHLDLVFGASGVKVGFLGMVKIPIDLSEDGKLKIFPLIGFGAPANPLVPATGAFTLGGTAGLGMDIYLDNHLFLSPALLYALDFSTWTEPGSGNYLDSDYVAPSTVTKMFHSFKATMSVGLRL